jgi:hypothetical protein
MKIRPLHKHLKPRKWYNNLFDEIVKDEVEERLTKTDFPDIFGARLKRVKNVRN